MPSWDEHVRFVKSKPYEAWYIIQADKEAGAIYLTRAGEIGIHLLPEYRGSGFGKAAIEILMSLHKRDRYLANIAPANEKSVKFFESMGFTHCQNTYELRTA